MSEYGQRYSNEFKEKTVQYIQEQTKSLPEIAEELNIPVGTLKQVMSVHRKFQNEPIASRETVRDKECTIDQQSREIADLKEEIAILQKAMRVFSKERN